MIRSIKLQNFRGFSKEVEIKIRPITVLIGRNSSGKSSVLKFLQMLRQTLETDEEEFFVTEGRHVHLGVFRDMRNKPSRSRYFTYSVTMSTSELPDRDFIEHWKGPLKHNLHLPPQGAEGEGASKVSENDVEVEYEISGKVFYGQKKEWGNHRVVGYHERRPFLEIGSSNLRRTSFLKFPIESQDKDAPFQRYIIGQFFSPLRYDFFSTRHLSPVREESQRMVQLASPPPNDVGHYGEHAIPHLFKLAKDDRDSSKKRTAFIYRHVSNVLRVDKLSFSDEMKGYFARCKARNIDTSAYSYLADFGFGVGQCLPIFIQGVLQHPGQLFTVEQPEAQLHPTAQIELGSYFAELWAEFKVPSIIETHSGNLLLRLRRLVKEKLLSPKDINVAFFHVTDGAAQVSNLEISEDGTLQEGLPMEFFGADILEALDMGANRTR